MNEPQPPDTPDPDIAQDPGIPGLETMSDRGDDPLPDAKDESAEGRERLDEPDREGHMSAPSADSDDETREG
ncbi:MAG: hypothetical protein ACRDN6_10710 [Gaiellaceae bacterium]